MNGFLKNTLGLALFLMAGNSIASPVIIKTSAPTISSAPYLQAINVNPETLLSQTPKSTLAALSQTNSIPNMQILPIKTNNMTPGIITPHAIEMPYLSNSVFLVGSDPLSQTWLTQHKAQIIKIHAIGLLVQAADKGQLAHMQQLAKPLILMPVSGEQVGKRLNLTHYPVLISHDQVDQ